MMRPFRTPALGVLARGLLVAAVLAVALIAAAGAARAQAPRAQDNRSAGHNHYFNLEYDEAIAAYRRLIAASPQDVLARNHLATALLFKELLRLGMLETSAFKGDNQFLRQEKPQPDPALKEEFLSVLLEGRQLAEASLQKSPDDKMALFALSNSYGLEGNYDFMIDKAYFSALRNGGRARKYANDLIKKHPDFVDAYLVAGVHEYVVGSLPWIVKVMAAIGGIRGNKQKGEGYVTRVAREGQLARNEARSLLTLLLRREKRPLEAAVLLEGLIRDFPRNYVLYLELGSMYEDAGEREKALTVFQNIRRKVAANEDNLARMPQRSREALERKVKDLETQIATSKSTAARLPQPASAARP
jgi:tetratricopeptide (TPR) repeat protein